MMRDDNEHPLYVGRPKCRFKVLTRLFFFIFLQKTDSFKKYFSYFFIRMYDDVVKKITNFSKNVCAVSQ